MRTTTLPTVAVEAAPPRRRGARAAAKAVSAVTDTAEHDAGVIPGPQGQHWMVCTCGYNALMASRDVAGAYVEDHLGVFQG